MDDEWCSFDTIVDALRRGERNRGSGGAIVIDRAAQAITYLLLDEIEPREVRESVAELLSEEGDRYAVVLHVRRDAQVDLHKLLRTALPVVA